MISQSQVRLINQREQLCHVAFPASVRDWFSIEGAADLFFHNSNNDRLENVEELGHPAEIRGLGMEKFGFLTNWFIRYDGSRSAYNSRNNTLTAWRSFYGVNCNR